MEFIDIVNNSKPNKNDNNVCESLARNNETNLNNNIKTNIYRYKFTNTFTDELYKFSKIHQYDHRKDFKEAWEVWIEENSELINEEIMRLHNLGYDGDILDKMFKSARYYFRKKSTEKKEPVKRRVYIGSQKTLLDAMDEHIKSNINTREFKPADGFDEFCNKNIEIIKDQINKFIQADITNSSEIKEKIKKTYKNRYFQFVCK
jgi:Fe-S cluster biosynthesis and repair protein YggX